MQKHSNKFMIGAFVGSTIGAMTTLLFSTAEGKKIRKKDHEKIPRHGPQDRSFRDTKVERPKKNSPKN